MQSVLSLAHFHDEAAAYAFVEARIWPNGPTCPHCGNADAARIGVLAGTSTRIGVKKCYACRKPFTVKIGTIFESSHVKMHLWLQAIALMCASKKGISSNQLHRTLGITLKSAWFLSHRIRAAMASNGNLPPMGGAGRAIEIDETYLWNKDGVQEARPGGFDKRAVLALVERHGPVRMFHIDRADAKTIRPTNTAEGVFSIFKRGMKGIYQQCAEHHLHRYLSEFEFRYNERIAMGVDDSMRAEKALKGVVGKRLTYRTTSQHG